MHNKAKKTKVMNYLDNKKCYVIKLVIRYEKAKQDYFSGEICNNANP